MLIRKLAVAALLVTTAAACGYSEEEWQAQLDKYNRLQNAQRAADAKIAQNQKDLAEAQARVAMLSKQLTDAGIDISKLNENLEQTSTKLSRVSASLEERERALAEYQARARQLEQIKARFDLLKSKLEELTKLGLAVSIRNNRMVISLPGDVLFDSGKDSLRKEGQEILLKVATVIKNDASLLSRQYQVAGHTDNNPLKGGQFRDNWGLSLMRARVVLLHLVGEKGGQLPPNRWSAAGFAETDPVGANDSDEGRQRNRRVELVVVPNVEEMLDLKAIAGAPAPAVTPVSVPAAVPVK